MTSTGPRAVRVVDAVAGFDGLHLVVRDESGALVRVSATVRACGRCGIPMLFGSDQGPDRMPSTAADIVCVLCASREADAGGGA